MTPCASDLGRILKVELTCTNHVRTADHGLPTHTNACEPGMAQYL